MHSGKHKLTIIATVVAIGIVSLAVWYTFRESAKEEGFDDAAITEDLEQVRAVSKSDHVRGSPNAPLVFIVYSDFGCPFCKDFHTTMSQIIDTYGKEGQVAWVFRHMPIIQLHRQSATYALASECVADEAGNTAFWKFSDMLFEASDPNVTLDQQQLLEMVDAVDVERKKFVDCMRDNKRMRDVEQDFEEAIRAGADGTPYTVVLTPRQRFTLKGQQTYRNLAGAIQTALPVLEADTILPPSAGARPDEFFDDETVLFDGE